MDAELAAKVGALLSDPEAAARISQIASSLGSGGGEKPVPSAEPDPRLALLKCLRSVVRSDRQQKIDTLINAFTAVSMIHGFGGNKNVQP